MTETFLNEKDLKVGIRVTVEQLSHIYDKYMIIVYDNIDDKEGTLVYINDYQNKEYDKWFMQGNAITPVYHSSIELEEGVVYDE